PKANSRPTAYCGSQLGSRSAPVWESSFEPLPIEERSLQQGRVCSSSVPLPSWRRVGEKTARASHAEPNEPIASPVPTANPKQLTYTRESAAGRIDERSQPLDLGASSRAFRVADF